MESTKIVATLGPATDPPAVLERLLDAGADVFRLNASHGTWDDHSRRIAAVREAAGKRGSHPGILVDLQGPKIRLGRFENGGCTLEAGREFTITTEKLLGNAARASTSYEAFGRDVKPGDTVLLADGSLKLEAVASDGVAVRCAVVTGGPIGDHKGINLPGAALSVPSLTEKDRDDLQHAVHAGVDFIALSFVRTAQDVHALARCLDEMRASIPIVAKIEKPEAWRNLDAVLDASGGVMVARGDLGVEMALERVPFIQKQIIARAREKGRFVITATQMLESMIEHPYPTRAEVSDVANAICDGTDAVMLSAETSVGKHPVLAVESMARIARETEDWLRPQGFRDPMPFPKPTNAEIVADAAYHAARSAGVRAIVAFTTSGSTARLISRFRPPVPVYAFTVHEHIARQLRVSFGVEPIIAPEVASTEEMLTQMERMLVEQKRLRPGDNVVFVAGHPIGEPGSANFVKLHRIRG